MLSTKGFKKKKKKNYERGSAENAGQEGGSRAGFVEKV